VRAAGKQTNINTNKNDTGYHKALSLTHAHASFSQSQSKWLLLFKKDLPH
jgi:hypothetical protein